MDVGDICPSEERQPDPSPTSKQGHWCWCFARNWAGLLNVSADSYRTVESFQLGKTFKVK